VIHAIHCGDCIWRKITKVIVMIVIQRSNSSGRRNGSQQSATSGLSCAA